MQNLWGENIHRRQRRKRKVVPLTKTPYSITGTGNDCEIIGHTLGFRDLAGCTVCLDCHAKIFCPACSPKHPQDETAVPVFCERHEESKGIA